MRLKSILLIITIAILCACTGSAPLSPSKKSPALPEAFYKKAQQDGERVLKIDSARSEVIINVYKAGALEKLGHDHVVATHQLSGYVLLPKKGAGMADLIVPLNSLTVDEPALRAQMKFATQPTQSDIKGTREHMLTDTLAAARFPDAYIHVDGALDQPTVNVQLTLHGVTQPYTVPITFVTDAQGLLTVAGKLTIKQTDFGITPYSVLGGLLQVQDAVDINFKIYTYPFSF